MTAIREQLIVKDKEMLEAIPFIQTVKRRLFGYEDLQKFSATQLPVAAIVGKLPNQIDYHKSSRKREVIEVIHSMLDVEAYIYFMCNNEDTMDTEISEKANTVFRSLFVNPGRDGLCLETLIKVEPNYSHWAPYVAFKVIATHYYIHTTGGI